MHDTRVLRVITRMNVGGPAHHVSLLGGRVDPRRYPSLLAFGETGSGEASFADLAAREGCAVTRVPGLTPEVRPVDDLRALRALIALLRRERPAILETHTAKAGFLGRLAALLAGRPRPVLIHTYHGHVLEGYFGPARRAVYRGLERALARVSDRLVTVSQATVDDLVRLRVAPAERFTVIPLGLDLTQLDELDEAAGQAFRREAGAGPEDVVVLYAGRLVGIKRVDVLLRAVAHARQAGAAVRLVVLGDGPLRGELEALADQLDLGGAVRFAGYRLDVLPALAGADVAALSSDNEGTPVALIEAAAAGLPAAATAVGGVPDVVTAGTGILVPSGDDRALGAALARLAEDPALRRRLGDEARSRVRARYGIDRLVADVEALYDELLTARKGATPAAGRAAPLVAP